MRLPTPRLLVVGMFAAGAVLRLATMATFSPAWYVNPDSIGYVQAAAGDLYSAVGHPAGYPAFLRGLHAVTDQLVAVTALQHALGFASAVLVYLTVRRLEGSRAVAAVPAAVILFSGDQLFFEQAVLTEGVFIFLVLGALYSASRAATGQVAWMALAGVLLGLATTIRQIGVFLVPIVCVWLLVWPGGRQLRQRLIGAAAGAAAALVVIGGYVALQQHATGNAALSRTSGWSAYARTAQFADCSRFDPPAGTSGLCESTPSDSRPGPTFYHWRPESPAWRVFGSPPAGDDQLGAFGRTVIRHQFGDYLRAVGSDEVRYFGLHPGPVRPYGGTEIGGLGFATGGQFRPQANAAFAAYYTDVGPDTAAASNALETYQSGMRVHPLLLAAIVALSIMGIVVCRGQYRYAVALFATTGLVLLLLPAATLIWAWRYGLPAQPLLAAAAAITAGELIGRARARARPAP